MASATTGAMTGNVSKAMATMAWITRVNSNGHQFFKRSSPAWARRPLQRPRQASTGSIGFHARFDQKTAQGVDFVFEVGAQSFGPRQFGAHRRDAHGLQALAHFGIGH